MCDEFYILKALKIDKMYKKIKGYYYLQWAPCSSSQCWWVFKTSRLWNSVGKYIMSHMLTHLLTHFICLVSLTMCGNWARAINLGMWGLWGSRGEVRSSQMMPWLWPNYYIWNCSWLCKLVSPPKACLIKKIDPGSFFSILVPPWHFLDCLSIPVEIPPLWKIFDKF
jgi:hypothetical protein